MRGAFVVGIIATAVFMFSQWEFVAAVEGDIVFARRADMSDEIPPAVFPHWVHRTRFKCYACHNAVFEMKAGTAAVTMDAIGQGKYCGVCHNGDTAFAVAFETCIRCHRQ